MVGRTLSLVLMLATASLMLSCSHGTAYSRISDVAQSPDGAAVYLVLERGQSRIEGNLFSGRNVETIQAVTVHRFDLGNGNVSQIASAAIDGSAAGESVRLVDRLPGLPAKPLKACQVLLGECARQAVPLPYTINGGSTGLRLVAPTLGVIMRWDGKGFTTTPFWLRTAEAVQAAADTDMRKIVTAVHAQATAELARMRAADPVAPTEVTGDRGLGDVMPAIEGRGAEYRLVPGGAILARVSYGPTEPSARIAWEPDRPCETDNWVVTRAVSECRYRESLEWEKARAEYWAKQRRN